MIQILAKAFIKVWLLYVGILAVQFVFTGMEVPVDGTLRVGFPYAFYSDSVWHDQPAFSERALWGNIKVILFISGIYVCFKYIKLRKQSRAA